jgi:hypothetical protein
LFWAWGWLGFSQEIGKLKKPNRLSCLVLVKLSLFEVVVGGNGNK